MRYGLAVAAGPHKHGLRRDLFAQLPQANKIIKKILGTAVRSTTGQQGEENARGSSFIFYLFIFLSTEKNKENALAFFWTAA